MALFNGDLQLKRLRIEHKDFQHRRVNNVKASTNATTYSGTWFTMASLDGINLEARRAGKYYKRRDYEVRYFFEVFYGFCLNLFFICDLCDFASTFEIGAGVASASD